MVGTKHSCEPLKRNHKLSMLFVNIVVSFNLTHELLKILQFWSINSADPTAELNRVYGGRVGCYLTCCNHQQYMAIVGKGGTTTVHYFGYIMK